MKVARSIMAGWGNHPVVDARRVEPSRPPGDVALLSGDIPLIPRGKGRSYGDASLPAPYGTAIDTRWLNKFVGFDSERGIVSAESGTSLEQLLDVIVPRGWFLPVSPGTRLISLGGALASNIHGKNHHRRGGIVDFVESLTALTENGPVECSRHQESELFRATVGGYGMTGVITQATLRLMRIETSLIEHRLIKVPDLATAMSVCEENDERYEYSVTWLDNLAGGNALGRGMVMLGNHARLDALPASRRGRALDLSWKRQLSAPRRFPGQLLNNVSNRLFNWAYGNKFLGRETTGLSTFESWFYPLDGIANWNRFYGAGGFVEYQCAIPLESAAAGLRAVLKRVHDRGLGSFLAVYKRIGRDNVTLPFAMPGYTLCLDFAAGRPGLYETLDELDEIVIEHGGRVYLSKDSRLKPAVFRRMYPEYPEWRAVVDRYAPGCRFQSRLSQRLEL